MDVNKKAVFLSIFTFALLIAFDAHTSPYLPIHHRVYDFLERMETRGIIPLSRLGIKPTTRTYAAELLVKVYHKKEQLSSIDREELEYFLEEFRYDLPPDFRFDFPVDHAPLSRLPGFLRFLYHNRQNFYRSVDDNYSLFFDPVLIRTEKWQNSAVTPENNSVHTAGNGFVLRGTVGEHVGYFVDVRDSKEWGSRTYNGRWKPPGIGWYHLKGDHAEYDETHAHLTYASGPFVISYGRGENLWGRAQSGSLELSDYSPPYDQVRFEVSFWRLRFMYILGEILQYPQIPKIVYEEQVDPNHFVAAQKYITAHRIEIDVFSGLSLGLYESVVFGDRFDFSYANPVTFLRGAEHSNHDHDNATLGGDFRFIQKRMSIYGDFFIDDITTHKIGSNWYGNKFGYQAGFFLVEPFSMDGLDVRAEYTRIKPWAYTHKYPINTYTHYGDCLGYYSGPNSDVVFAKVRKRFTRSLAIETTFTQNRHGENFPDRNIGGDIMQGHSLDDTTSSHFLDGIITESLRIGFGFTFEIVRNLFIASEYALVKENTEKTHCFTLSFEFNGVE